MVSINKELKDLLERFEIDKKVGIDSSMLVRFLLSSINSMENLRDSIIEKEEKKNDSNNDEEFVEQMYKLYPSKCPKRQSSLGKTQKDKDRIRKLLKKYSKEDIERVIRNEIDTKYGIAYMQNFSTFLNNFPDPTQIDNYNEFKGISIKPLPKGWEQERYDMYIRNGYTITEDGRLFKDGKEIK